MARSSESTELTERVWDSDSRSSDCVLTSSRWSRSSITRMADRHHSTARAPTSGVPSKCTPSRPSRMPAAPMFGDSSSRASTCSKPLSVVAK
eukprot:scaffold4145_cov115-Isochrysis_galbana.AAC.4